MNKTNNEVEICDVNVIHKEKIENVTKKLITEDQYQNMSELYKVFSDKTRLKIISILLNQEMCVCDISFVLKMNQSAISHQLKVLKQMRLVKYRRKGKVVYYSLNDKHVSQIFEIGFEHINE
ncbi:MAG: metalloregulator ArsR/SmtB family transcription factor [Clostridiales bacterium]